MADEIVELRSGKEWQAVIKALKVQDAAIPRKIKSTLRQRANITVRKVKARALALPSSGRDSTGLRTRVARGVRLRFSRSLSSARIITTMADPEEAALPRGLDAPEGWRHPVFPEGPRQDWEWVQQYGDSWFKEPIAEDRDEYARAFAEVFEEASAMINRVGD